MANPKDSLKDKVAQKAAVTTTSQQPMTLRSQLERMRDEVNRLVNDAFKTDRILRLTENQARTNLGACSVRSIIGFCMNSVSVGLEPGPLGHVWGVPFRNNKTGETECQFMIGVRGWIKLARNAGCFLDAKCVYENDEFKYEYGFEPSLTHIPAASNRGKLLYVYAIAKDTDGHRYLEVMSVEDVERIRKVSKAGQSGPWVDWFDEMAKKTVIKRLAKALPLDTAFEKARAYDSTTNTLTAVEDEYGNRLPSPSLRPDEVARPNAAALVPALEHGEQVDDSGWQQTTMLEEATPEYNLQPERSPGEEG